MVKSGKSNVAVVGTFDTKGSEAAFLIEVITQHGFNAISVDVGTGAAGKPPFVPDYPCENVAEIAGSEIEQVHALVREGKSAEWIELMGKGAATLVKRLHDAGKIDGVISFGGNAGTSLGAIAMRALPLGVPKVILSTVASGNTRPYVGAKDICMVPAVADIAGLNRVTKVCLRQAAGALIGMIGTAVKEVAERPLVAVTEIGRLADNGPYIRKILEEHGYEVVLFHAVGTGGMAMEEMIEQGQIKGVLELSLNEVTDHLHGGFCDAGPARMEAAARKGIPAVIAPGYISRIVFPSKAATPERYARRQAWQHGVSTYIVTVTREEMIELAQVLAEKINQYTGPTIVMLPLKGLSRPKEIFDNAEANAAFFAALKHHLAPHIRVKELNAHALDREFAEEAAQTLVGLLIALC